MKKLQNIKTEYINTLLQREFEVFEIQDLKSIFYDIEFDEELFYEVWFSLREDDFIIPFEDSNCFFIINFDVVPDYTQLYRIKHFRKNIKINLN